jgi:hypothetical protein
VTVGWLLTCGCHPPGQQRYPISGTVTLDGLPVENATIILTPQGEGLAAAAAIVNGQFAMSSTDGPTQGEFGVRINPTNAELDAANPADSRHTHRRPRIPKLYQQDGKLTASISGEPAQTLDIALSSSEN